MVDLKSDFDGGWESLLDPVTLAKHLPAIIRDDDEGLTRLILNKYSPQDSAGWLPEAMMLLNLPRLQDRYKQSAMQNMFPSIAVSDDDALSLARITARIGRIGYSFPQWRFMAQGYVDAVPSKKFATNPASLLERYGMQRLTRETDVRDATLPPGHPDRDHFGTGYIKTEGRWHIEFRRAYILCAHHDGPNTATMVIRNNSYFYGRDRLPAPCYVTWEKMSTDDLNAIDDSSFAEGGPFMQLEEALGTSRPRMDNKIFRLWAVLNFIDSEDMLISHWMRGNYPALTNFMTAMLDRQEKSGKDGAPFYLCEIDPKMPPWFPKAAIPVTRDSLNNVPLLLKPFKDQQKFVILSGPNGDFPVHPDAPVQKSAPTAPELKA